MAPEAPHRTAAPTPDAAERQSLRETTRAATFDPESPAQVQGLAGNLAIGRALAASGIRPKLTVSQPGDPDEEQADRVADAVVSRSALPTISRTAENEAVRSKRDASIHAPAAPRAHDALAAVRSSGHPLPTSLRTAFEPRFDRDLSQVRLHTDSTAGGAARAIGARAYAVGPEIAFAPGEYRPHEREGQRLLAHELAHVAQHSATGAAEAIHRQDAGSGGMTSGTAPASVTATTTGPVASTQTAADIEGRALVQKAIDSRDVSDVKKIKNFVLASTEERLKLIAILLDQTWVGPYDEYALEDIWHSFGSEALKIASTEQGFALWTSCIDRGTELDNLALVTSLKSQFTSDIKTIVTGYLFQNRQFVANEMRRLGLTEAEGAKPAAPTAEQSEEIQEMQTAAALIAKLQKSQEMVRGNVLVGYEPNRNPPLQPMIGENSSEYGQSLMLSTPMFVPVFFDPFKAPPPLDHDPSLLGSSARTTSYKTVKGAYDAVSQEIQEWVAGYPALYSITREGKSKDTEAFSKQGDVAAARRQIGAAMRMLLADIEATQRKLDDDSLNPLDLTPIHAQLLGGAIRGPSAYDWSGRLAQSIAKGMIGSHEFNQVLLDLGLQTAATALFMLAPLTGGASLYVLLAGTGVLATKAYLSSEYYDAIAQASKTAVTPGTVLVGDDQVERARRAMEADKVAVTLAALAVGISAATSAISAVGGPIALAADKAATRAIVASDIAVAKSLAQRALSGPIPESELLALQEVGLVTRLAQRWANYRGFQILYRGQTSPTGQILSPIARQQGLPASQEMYQQMRDQGLTDQEIANYTARWNGVPVPPFDAPPGMANQPLGGVGIPSTRLPNVASDFAQAPTGIIYVLRVPKSVPVQIGQGGWGAQSALEQEYVFFHQIPNGYVARTLSPKGIGPLRYDAPPVVGPSLVTPPSTP